MKIILQDYEPRQQPLGEVERKTMARKARVRLLPVVAETRLFHAL